MTYAYTDGSTFHGNPAPISWAIIFVRDGEILEELTGAFNQGNNNRAELMAVICALEYERFTDFMIVSDSQLTVHICNGKWVPQKNLDLWTRFDQALADRERRGLFTDFVHIRGHRTPTMKDWSPEHSPFNTRADVLAKEAGERAHGHLVLPTET